MANHPVNDEARDERFEWEAEDEAPESVHALVGESTWRKRIALAALAMCTFGAGYAMHVLERPPVPTEAAAASQKQVTAKTEGAETNTIVVDVHGDVRHPGVYRLSVNARVQDAVNAAGGYLHPEDKAGVNGAAVLDDGAEVVVPNAASGSTANGAWNGASSLSNSGQSALSKVTVGQTSGQTPAPESVVKVTPIDINTATVETLETLPGIGPSKADAILKYRSEHGPFRTLRDILNVPGIGQATAAKLAPYLNLPG